MISVFEFQEYRQFLKAWVVEAKQANPSVRGLKSRLARAAGVSPAMMSLIFNGHKQMSLEQAAEVAEFLNLNEMETDYFLLLADLGRAGSFKLRQKLERRMRELQKAARQIANRVPRGKEISDEIRAIYYSNWQYTGIRNLCAIPEFQDPAAIARRLGLGETQVLKVLDFLVEHGFVKREAGRLDFGPTYIHQPADSPFAARQHQNWRLRGFQFMEQLTESNLFYTCPMSLSSEAVEEIRKLLPTVIDDVLKIMKPSPSERAFCFNVDWFEY